jgi:FHA domain
MNETDKNRPETETANIDSSNTNASVDLSAEIAKALEMERQAKGEATTESTTNDLQQEAFKAMKLEAERRREEEDKAKAADVNKLHFTEGMRLKLEMQETREILVRDLGGELVVGRADNVTDYVPEIDLSPHGAYRLGLSRRHAIILRDNERLVVKDLNSRNGTFVNGTIVASGGSQILRDGDELRFGNLAMRVIFERA